MDIENKKQEEQGFKKTKTLRTKKREIYKNEFNKKYFYTMYLSYYESYAFCLVLSRGYKKES